jgi:ribosomal protein S18 acetylase RimI-like enzyme
VVAVDGQDVGRFWLTRRPGVVELSGLELVPAWRSRGVGAEVLRRLVTVARGEGRRLELEVDEDNVPAQRFYERAGLVRVTGTTRRRRYAAPGAGPVRR